ncbi:SpaA isopeptide-forming pilin-related protein, partial [Enterococcus avium]
MHLRTRKKWLKVAALLAFSQFCFLTGAFQAQAEETTPSQPTVETTASAPVEAVEVQSVEEVPAIETPAESVLETNAPTTNSKAVLDQTIGEAQNPGDSPAVTQPVETSETEISPEPSEESTTPSSEPAETTESTDTPEATTPEGKPASDLPVSTESSVEKVTDTPATDTEKSVEQPGDNKDTEEKTEDSAMASDTKETTMTDKEMKDTFVVTQPTNTRVRRAVTSTRAANDNIVRENLVGQGINWATVNDPGRPGFTFDGIPMFTVNGQAAFCIQPGVDFNGNGQVHSTQTLDTYLKDASKRHKITLISYFGYVNNPDKSKEQYFATQLMIGEVLGRQVTWTYDALNYNVRKAAIQKLVNDFDKRVSFNNETRTVKVGETIEVTDTNNVLKDIIRIEPSSGVTAKIQGNQLVITATKDASENATVKLFKLKAMSSPMVYKKPGSQTIGVLNPNEPNSSLLRLNVLKQGNIHVFKEDSETGKTAQGAASLENAVYGLYQADGKKIKEITLKNVNGKVQAEIKDLDPGKYVLKEIKAPKGYVISDEAIEVVVEPGKTVNMTAKDQVIKGTIEGVKVGNKDFVDTKDPDNKPKLEGIEISLTSKTTGKVVKTVLTDKDGYFTFGKNAVVFDTYIVSETKGKEGYKLFEPFEVMISEQGQTFRYVLEDQIIEQQVKIVKVDQETGKVIPLANTEFKIFDTLANEYVTFAIPNDTEVTDIFRTNDKGYLVTNGTFTYGNNRYRIEEINAPRNYVLNKTPLVFSITDDTEPIKVINFANRQARKNVKLFKYEEWNKKKTPLAGVTFTLYNGEGKALGEYTTDTNGELLVKGLVAGAYYFVEKAPLESFQPNTDKQAFTVAFKQNAPDDGETLLVSVRNYLIPPTLETQASNKEDGEKVIDPLEKVVIKDSVSYTNLFVGKEYTISGVLMNKATNAPILQDGKEITSTLTFVADKTNGTKDLEFVVNASVLKGQTIVVFEKL